MGDLHTHQKILHQKESQNPKPEKKLSFSKALLYHYCLQMQTKNRDYQSYNPKSVLDTCAIQKVLDHGVPLRTKTSKRQRRKRERKERETRRVKKT